MIADLKYYKVDNSKTMIYQLNDAVIFVFAWPGAKWVNIVEPSTGKCKQVEKDYFYNEIPKTEVSYDAKKMYNLILFQKTGNSTLRKLLEHLSLQTNLKAENA
jgi:hypothetical protein